MARTVAPEHIAGLKGVGGTDLADAVRETTAQMRGVPAERRVLLVIHDGGPSDMDRAKAEIAAAKRSMTVVGILLGDPGTNAGLVDSMRQMFGGDLICAEHADALMKLLGVFLARLLRPVS
jgi:Mg-chelatase subunit ChlD